MSLAPNSTPSWGVVVLGFFRVYKWVAWGTYGWIWVYQEALVCESDEEG